MLGAAGVCALGLLLLLSQQHTAAALHPHHLVRSDEKESLTSTNSSGKIPHILHYVYLGGFDKFVEEAQRPDSKLQRNYYDNCISLHKHWEVMFWTEDMAVKLLKESYSWFLPIWQGYDNEAKRSDALRVFVLEKYGGLYLDFDIECYRPADESFKQYSIVLQGTGDEGINNAAMASMPGHPLWKLYADVLTERSTLGTNQAQRAPMWMTGTLALTKGIFQLLQGAPRPPSGYLGGEYKVDATVLKIYPIGEWYVPCYGIDIICLKRFEREKLEGTWEMANLYGRHYFVESLDRAKRAQQQKLQVVPKRFL